MRCSPTAGIRTPRAVADELTSHGASAETIDETARLGRPFPVVENESPLSLAVAEAARREQAPAGEAEHRTMQPDEIARIRTAVGVEMFRTEHGRDPRDANELSALIAAKSRTPAPAIAGYDLTFSPVKSVSVLWALAPQPVAEAVRAAHDAAVANVMRWLEREAVFTRQGRNGCRQVDTRGLIAAAFTHRDSRNGDPDLHTHVAVSNKVQALDGSWLALDGRVLHAAAVAASERYNTRIETELRARLGVRFAERP